MRFVAAFVYFEVLTQQRYKNMNTSDKPKPDSQVAPQEVKASSSYDFSLEFPSKQERDWLKHPWLTLPVCKHPSSLTAEQARALNSMLPKCYLNPGYSLKASRKGLNMYLMSMAKLFLIFIFFYDKNPQEGMPLSC